MNEASDQVQQALGGRYVIERELGRGGMACVYLARDSLSDGPVAIKVLHPDLAMALGADRFRREVQIERTLSHPNILAVLEAGEAQGLLYYVMPYVAGESLRARMDRENQLGVDDAIRIAIQIGRALEHAHGKGIVHRDIKPENILLDRDTALLADFGIARALTPDVAQRLTQTGVSMGTPAYMSPEQSTADRNLDGRGDVYALGCVLYEMLVGQPPFTGPSAQAVMARHHLESVPSMVVVRPTISDALEDIVFRALAKTPADRWPSARAFADALESCLSRGLTVERRTVARSREHRPRSARRRSLFMGAGAAAALLLLVGAWALRSGDGLTREADGAVVSADSPLRRVAVLYFNDNSPGEKLGYLADGVSESLMKDLSHVSALQVVSRSGVRQFRGSDISRDSIGRALNVGLLVDGRVEEDGDRVRVTVELVDAASGASLTPRPWSITTPVDSTRALRDSVSAEVAEWLRQRIGDEVRLRGDREAAASEAAWTLAQRAAHSRKRADEAWERGDTVNAAALLALADSLNVAAAAAAPGWAEPVIERGEMALVQAERVSQPSRARPFLEQALALADSALARDSSEARALQLRGAAAYQRVMSGLVPDTAEVARVVAASERDLREAVDQDPTLASAWVRLSELSYRQLNIAQAHRDAQSAYEADAFLDAAPSALWRLFATSYDLEQPMDARQWCMEGARRFPEAPNFLRCQILLMTMRGATPDIPRAWQLADSLADRWPEPVREYQERFDRILVAVALARAQLPDSARAVLVAARADRRIDPRGELRGLEAFARATLGDDDEALSLLEGYLRDYPEHRAGFAKLNSWWWQGINQEPRFARLVRGG